MSHPPLDTSAAQAYEDHLVHSLFAPWAQRVVDHARPVAGESVLDVACGTGIGARLVAPLLSPGGSIVSADIDPGMIAVAKSTHSNTELPSDVSVEWHAHPGELPLVQEGSIDLCLCLQGPQFLTDPTEGMVQIYRSLKTGGRLAASVWNEYSTNKGHYAIGQALQKRGIKPAIKPFSFGNPEHAKALFELAGFEIEYFSTDDMKIAFPSTKQFVDGVAAGAPATRHALAQLEAADLEAFIGDVDVQLAPYKTPEGLQLPTSAHIVVARK